MARKNLYERLDNLGVNVYAEYDALMRLIKHEQVIWYGHSYHSVIKYIDNFYFRKLPAKFRSPFLSVEEMMAALNLPDMSYDLDSLFLLSELLIAILPLEYTKQDKDLERQSLTIRTNIVSFLEKLNVIFIFK